MNFFIHLYFLKILNRPIQVHTHPDSSLDAVSRTRKFAKNFAYGQITLIFEKSLILLITNSHISTPNNCKGLKLSEVLFYILLETNKSWQQFRCSNKYHILNIIEQVVSLKQYITRHLMLSVFYSTISAQGNILYIKFF